MFPVVAFLAASAGATAATTTLAHYLTGDGVLTNKAANTGAFAAGDISLSPNWISYDNGNSGTPKGFRNSFGKAGTFENVSGSTGNNWLAINSKIVANSPAAFSDQTNPYFTINLSSLADGTSFNLSEISFDVLFANDAGSSDKVGIGYGISINTGNGFTTIEQAGCKLSDGSGLLETNTASVVYGERVSVDLSAYTDLANAELRVELYKLNSNGADGIWGNYSGNSRLTGISNLTVTGTVIPEPSTYALFGGIFATGVALAVRRRRKG